MMFEFVWVVAFLFIILLGYSFFQMMEDGLTAFRTFLSSFSLFALFVLMFVMLMIVKFKEATL